MGIPHRSRQITPVCINVNPFFSLSLFLIMKDWNLSPRIFVIIIAIPNVPKCHQKLNKGNFVLWKYSVKLTHRSLNTTCFNTAAVPPARECMTRFLAFLYIPHTMQNWLFATQVKLQLPCAKLCHYKLTRLSLCCWSQHTQAHSWQLIVVH